MDRNQFVREPARVLAVLKELPDLRLVTTKPLKVYIPTRFAERGLAQIGIETHIVGIAMLVVEDKYSSILMVNAMMRIDPTSTVKVKMGEDEFYEFFFEPGSTFISSLELVKTDTLVYKIYDELFSKGRVPWYVTYSDLGKIFNTAREHAGANIGGNHEVTELLVSMIARNSSDRHQYYRQSIEKMADLIKNPPAFIPLRSVTYSATNTTNKLGGSYFHEGVVSALNSPAERVERLESLLRR
jgi:hypothetical protein